MPVHNAPLNATPDGRRVLQGGLGVLELWGVRRAGADLADDLEDLVGVDHILHFEQVTRDDVGVLASGGPAVALRQRDERLGEVQGTPLALVRVVGVGGPRDAGQYLLRGAGQARPDARAKGVFIPARLAIAAVEVKAG